MWNVFSSRCTGLLTAALLALAIGAASAQTAPARAPFDLIGAWRGEAVLNSDATPILVEFVRCGENVCARLSLPELDTEGVPLGPVSEDARGRLSALPLTLTRADQRLQGELAGAGGDVFIAAMGHGRGPARINLTRRALPTADVREEDVVFRNGDVALAGTLVKPTRARGRLPAIVAVLGSSSAPRWYSLSRARAWARLGYATLVYDKRGSGDSGGDWRTSSLDDLADDVVAAFRFLQTRNDVRADRIGLWAHSQGGWVAPRAMVRGADAAFLIAVSGGGATPTQVERYGYAGTLAHMGVQGAELARANATIERYFSYLAGDIDLAALSASNDEVSATPWFRGLGLARVIPAEAERSQWRWVATYDPADDIASLSAPILVLLAGEDDSTPLRDSVQGWTNALAHSASSNARVVVYPNADHHMGVEAGEGWRRVSPAYNDELTRYLLQQRARQL